MYNAVSGQSAIFKQMQVIANNLANMATHGYKAEKVMFEKSLNEAAQRSLNLPREGGNSNPLNSLEFASVRGAYTDLSQGAMQVTGNPLDVAIQGEGFFVVMTEQGERYTRSGAFTLDSAGRLVTPTGDPVQGDGGDIVISGGGAVQIEQDGEVRVNGESRGRLRVTFLSDQNLIRESSLQFRAREGSTPIDQPEAKILSGTLEGSNVNAVRELTDMLQAARLYEALQKTQESNSRMSRGRNEVFGRS
ncbi:MAG: flagellar basal-body rod protein FlgF [Bradymonadales bacterium]|nr:MAG: flagellar basal-body rod protein FlgF [Bradymonadales bacterium]